MSDYPIHDLLVTSGEDEYGYFVYTKGESPLGTVLRQTEVNIAATEAPGASGGAYSVRDQDQPALCVSDWSKGAGQTSYEVEDSVTSKFHSSSAIDTARKGELRLAKASALTAASTSTGIVFSALGTVFQSYTGPLVKGWDGSAFDTIGLTGPTAQVLCFATDGQYLYASFGVDGIYRVKEEHGNANWDDETLALWCNPSESIVKMAYSGGYMYGATTSAVGYFDDTPAFNQLSQAVLNPVVSTFGLATAGNWVYWGTSKEGITKLYRVQFDGTYEWVEDVCDFPKGFVATSMASYLGNVFVGGYYECATTNAGQGAVYLISDDTSILLTTVGENPDYSADPSSLDNDNRIWDLFPYGKDLYILATRKVLRWDLDDGGWVQVMDVPQGTTSSAAWLTTGDLDYTAAALPDSGTWTASGTGTVAADASGVLTISTTTGNTRTYTAVPAGADALDNATGTTMEVTIPAKSAGVTPVSGDGGVFGFDDGTYQSRARVWRTSTSDYYRVFIGAYVGGSWSYPAVTAVSDATAHTLRLVSKGKRTALYVDGVLLTYTTSLADTASTNVFFSGGYAIGSGGYVKYDSLYITNDGAFAPGAEYGPSTIGTIAALDNKFFVGISGVGYVTSATTYETEGWLRLSSTAAKSGSLQKTYHSIIIDHDTLAAPEGISVEYLLDHSEAPLTATVSDATDPRRTVFAVNQVGRTIAPIVTLTGDGTTTPVVRGITLTYDFAKYRQHSYMLDCRRGCESGLWTYDPEKAITHLFTVGTQGGTFEDRFSGSYSGQVQSCEFVQAQRSERGTLEGIVQLVVRELE